MLGLNAAGDTTPTCTSGRCVISELFRSKGSSQAIIPVGGCGWSSTKSQYVLVYTHDSPYTHPSVPCHCLFNEPSAGNCEPQQRRLFKLRTRLQTAARYNSWRHTYWKCLLCRSYSEMNLYYTCAANQGDLEPCGLMEPYPELTYASSKARFLEACSTARHCCFNSGDNSCFQMKKPALAGCPTTVGGETDSLDFAPGDSVIISDRFVARLS